MKLKNTAILLKLIHVFFWSFVFCYTEKCDQSVLFNFNLNFALEFNPDQRLQALEEKEKEVLF